MEAAAASPRAVLADTMEVDTVLAGVSTAQTRIRQLARPGGGLPPAPSQPLPDWKARKAPSTVVATRAAAAPAPAPTEDGWSFPPGWDVAEVTAKLEARGSEARVSNLLAVKSTALAVRAPAELAVASKSTVLERVWAEAVADGSGELDQKEVAGVLRTLTGEAPSGQALEAAMTAMDADGSGEVDFDEFSAWWL